MDKRLSFKKAVAWLLIAAIVNPAAMAPAFARDTDIFLTVTAGATNAEPNILLALGTNDRMNIPEPWREYPGAYDSHTEYLWNNITAVSNTEVASENASSISTATQAVNPFSTWGFWAGASLADRQALWTAAKNSANATESGDPGPRNTWRNYNDLSLLYWVPKDAAITDARLRSVSLNTFRGHRSVAAGVRGGIAFTSTSPYPLDASNPGNSPLAVGGVWDFRSFNQCASSIPLLTPSTVFAPDTAPVNAGMMLNQQWVRYDRWLNLTPINLAGYPGTTAQGGGGATAAGYYRGYLDAAVAPTQVAPGFPVPPSGPAGTPPTNTYRDNDRVGTGVLGMPIRVPVPTSYAGWTDLKADTGGFELLYRAYYYQYGNSGANSNPAGLMPTLRSVYGYTKLNSGDTYDEVLSAYKGTRDAAPAFGMATGTPAYYDQTFGNCSPTTGPSPNTSPTNTTCINVAAAGAAQQNATWTRTCSSAGSIVSERDAANTTRFKGVGLSCNNNGAIVCASDPRGLGCAGLTPPALNCTLAVQNQFLTRKYDANCSWSGLQADVIDACQWSARQSVFIEGQGTYFYGGSCQEHTSTTHCSAAGTTKTLNGVSRANVLGPYVGQPPANATTTLGCSNAGGASNAGTYSYGGTCGGGTEWTVSSSSPPYPTPARTLKVPTECQVTGGFSGTVRNGAVRTYNQTCGSLGDVDQTCSGRYGTSCLTSASITTACPANISAQTVAVAAGSATNNWYQTYRLQASDSNLVHDCLADQPAFNPGANTYMSGAKLAFGAAWSSATGYTSNSAQAVATDDTKKINVYSVNWLNWKFGPKGPNGAPIGRKTRLQIAKDALSNLVQTTDGVRFGLMVHNRTASTLTNDGANVVSAIKRMGNNAADADYGNRAAMITAINTVVASSRTPLTETLYEAYLYFSGRAPRFGTSTATALIGGTVTQGRDTTAVCGATVGPGCPVANAYRSPMLNNPNTTTPGTCQKNFVILITNGQPEDDAAVNADIKSMVSTVDATLTLAPRTTIDTTEANTTSDQFEQSGAAYGPLDAAGTASDGGYVWLDELAYFMSKADVSPGARNFPTDTGSDLISGRQSIVTYTIGFAGVPSPVVQNAAEKAGGMYYDAQDSSSLGAALIDAIAAIREWNPTVAAPSVPVSALNRAENANDVYLAFFKPDPTQVWDGTVKRFRLGTSQAECGTDANSQPITLCMTSKVVSTGGFLNIEKQEVQPDSTVNIVIDDVAQSYWTPTPDGGKPTLGGTGYQVINTPALTPKTRKVYSWFSSVSTSADTTAATNQVTEVNTETTSNPGGKITKAMLGLAAGAPTDTTALNLINYIRGGNAIGACADGNASTDCITWRAWAHADVQHSRPAVVTYDPTPIADAEVPALQQPAKRAATQFLYYLSNDGLLHAVDANTGKEQWVFLVEEALPLLKTLQTDGAGQQLNIADGSPVTWVKDVNGNGKIEPADGDKVYLYFGLRRGGRAYYALDVTQKDAPAMLWKISNTTTCGPVGTSCAASTVYGELGQSWSNPVVGNVRALGIGVPALVFGGGYDPNQDNYKVSAADTMGRALFVVNGQNGSLVQSFGAGQSGDMSLTGAAMTYSVPSDPAALNTDQDAQGFFDRVYIGDTGGYLWRFDINNPNVAFWTGKLLANLSSDTLATTDRRKILFPPAAVKQNYGVVGRFDAVYVGTGDREHPTKTQTVSPATPDSVPPAPDDKIFMLKDPDWDVNRPVSATTYTFADLLHLTGGTGITDASLQLRGGWYLDLDSNCTPSGSPALSRCGEKVTSAPTVFFNKLRFGSYATTLQPNACVPAGEGRLNEIDALTGAFTINLPTNGSPSKDRYYSDFLARGYMSTGQLIVVGKNIYNITVADGRLHSLLVGTIGAATKVYWYMEPEL